MSEDARDATVNDEPPHLTEHEIAGYLDRTLGDGEHARVEAHLADCGSCGQELVLASRSLSKDSRGPGRKLAVPLAAAATIAAVAWLGPQILGSQGGSGPVLRDAGSDSGPRVLVVQPADRATLSRDSLLFIWRPVAGDAFYSFRLTDVAGDILWEGSTSDTLISLDREIVLRDGLRYFWYVDALFEDGREASTGVHEIVGGR